MASKANKAIEAVAYEQPRGNKAIAKSSTSKAIAAQHVAFSTRSIAGVPLVDYALRVMAVGGDLRYAGWRAADANYSVGTTRVVHTFAHTSSLPKGSALACAGMHAGGERCSAVSKNVGSIDATTYRYDGAPDIAATLDNEGSLVANARAYFATALRNAIAQGLSDPARLLACAGVAQLLQHPRHGAAMRATFDAAFKAPAKRERKARVVAVAPASEGTGTPTLEPEPETE